MLDYSDLGLQLAWPLAMTLAWMAGELVYRWTALPRIAVYGLAGFVFGNLAAGYLPPSEAKNFMWLANLGFGLILFELGYRINLRWLKNNPWIVATSLLEAICTFGVVYLVAWYFGMERLPAALTASLAMSSSPAGLLRVLNEQGASGQVTERAMHLTALNCVMAVFTFNIVVGIGVFQTSGDLTHAAGSSLLVLVASSGLGALFGALVPLWLRIIDASRDGTLAFALAVVLLVAITSVLPLSPVLAALTFGLVARHRRVAFSQAQRNFGALGELLTVLLFVFAASTLDWEKVAAGIWLAVAVVIARLLTKTAGVTAFAHLSGVSWRKGFLAGVALAPLSVFVILLLEHARLAGVVVVEELRSVAAVTMLLEIFGPIIIQRALMWARETPDIRPENRHAA
ncbi:MAG TPA: sodium:proton antiporter [Massilia sp.]|nr:sodium:proton antiporter [Massilia sp.]